MADKRRTALSLQKMKNLRRQSEHFLVFMTNRKKNIRTKMLFRTPGKKLQISWTLLKTVSFLFSVNFRPKVQHGILINLFLKTEDIFTL